MRLIAGLDRPNAGAAAITPTCSYLHELVEREGCGRWFANGDAEGLADWIEQLRADPSAAATFGHAARHLLERTATPEIVTDHYLQLIQQHLPEHKPLPASIEQQARSAFAPSP
jgi:glycosyltransferase involved in cell wall biosynthesis